MRIIYSLGVMMYEMLTRRRLPYDGDNPMNVLFRHLDGNAHTRAHEVNRNDAPRAVSQRRHARRCRSERDDRPQATRWSCFEELSRRSTL